jgi:hypothetical protein
MIELDFFKPQNQFGNAKITIQKTGRFGFNKVAIEELNLKGNRFCKIGKNRADENDLNLYIILLKDGDSTSFNISKAGDYFYIKAGALLKDIGIDYKNEKKTFIYDVEKADENIFRLKQRIIEKK